jgi:hypothetical protein
MIQQTMTDTAFMGIMDRLFPAPAADAPASTRRRHTDQINAPPSMVYRLLTFGQPNLRRAAI